MDEPRGPHLPDWLTSRARRIPGRAWIFIVIAVLDAIWRANPGGQIAPDAVFFGVIRAVPGAMTCLIGAALLTRHPRAWATDRYLVVGSILFVVVEAIDFLSSSFRSSGLFAGWFPDDNGWLLGPALALDALGGVLTVFAIAYIARGLLTGRVSEEWEGSPWSTVPIWAVTVLAASFGLASYALALVQDGGAGIDPGYAVYLVILIVTATLIIAGWGYVTTLAATGSVNGEGPPNAWAIAATGGLSIVAGYLLSAIATVAGWLILSPTTEVGWTLTLASGASIVRAVGFILLLVAFALGLPASEEDAV